MKIRLQRSTLAESMETMAEIEPVRSALVAYLEPQYGDVSRRRIEVKPYCPDNRIGWDTHLVVVDGHAVAFTDGPLADEESGDEMDVIVERILAGQNPRALSTGEQIAAAFLFNQLHWLPASYCHPLDALTRLGGDWTEKMLAYHNDPRRNRTGEYP